MQSNRLLIDHSPDGKARYSDPYMRVAERSRYSLSADDVNKIVAAVMELDFAKWATQQMNNDKQQQQQQLAPGINVAAPAFVRSKDAQPAAPLVQRNSNDGGEDQDDEDQQQDGAPAKYGEDPDVRSVEKAAGYSRSASELTPDHAQRIHDEANRYSKLGKHKSFTELRASTARTFHRREPSPAEISAIAERNARIGKYQSYEAIRNELRNRRG